MTNKPSNSSSTTTTISPRQYYDALDEKDKQRFQRFVFNTTTTSSSDAAKVADFINLFQTHPQLAKLCNQIDLGLGEQLHPCHIAVFHYGRCCSGGFDLVKTILTADPDSKFVRTCSIGFQELVPKVLGSTSGGNGDDSATTTTTTPTTLVGWTPLEIAALEKNHVLFEFIGRQMFKRLRDFESYAPYALFASIMSKDVDLATSIAKKFPRAIIGDVTMKRRFPLFGESTAAKEEVDVSPLAYVFSSLPETDPSVCTILQSFLKELEQQLQGDWIWQSLKLVLFGGGGEGCISGAGKRKGKILGTTLARHENVSVTAENWTSEGLKTLLSTISSSTATTRTKTLRLYVPKSLHTDSLVKEGLELLVNNSSSSRLETLVLELRYGQVFCPLFETLATVLPNTKTAAAAAAAPIGVVLSHGHVYKSNGFELLLSKTRQLKFDNIVFTAESLILLVNELCKATTLEDVSFNFCRADGVDDDDDDSSIMEFPKEVISTTTAGHCRRHRRLAKLTVTYSDSLLAALGNKLSSTTDKNFIIMFESFHLTLLSSKVSNESLKKILSFTISATLDFGFVANVDLHHLSRAIKDCSCLSHLTLKLSSNMELSTTSRDALFEATRLALKGGNHQQLSSLIEIDFQGLEHPTYLWSEEQWSQLQYLISRNRAGLRKVIMNQQEFPPELLAPVLGRVSSTLSGRGLSCRSLCVCSMDQNIIRSSILFEMLRNHPSLVQPIRPRMSLLIGLFCHSWYIVAFIVGFVTSTIGWYVASVLSSSSSSKHA